MKRRIRERIEKITDKDVLRGIENFQPPPKERESIEYDLVHEGERYPLKEIVRYAYMAALERRGELSTVFKDSIRKDIFNSDTVTALEKFDGSQKDEEFTSIEAKNFLEDLGFKILRKNQKNDVWIFRSGRNCEFEKECLDKGYVRGGSSLGNLEGKSEGEIESMLIQQDPKERQNEITKWKNELFHLSRIIHKGDKIFMPLKDTSKVAVGTAKGNYLFQEKRNHIIPVEWINKSALRKDFPYIKEELGYRGTIKRITDKFSDNTQKGEGKVTETEILRQFHQIILQGPPGTGKTYTAKEIVKDLTGDNNEQWEIIQFHPSYNYEDFVRGIQIKTKNGQVVYETVNRVLAEMAEKAIGDPDNPYVLIIDEINRANVAAVLGELIYALEYRGEPVSTTHKINGKAEITLPKNFYIIGTMNTADRTIGQIDYAVRRRFAFITLSPECEVVENVAKENKVSNAVEMFNMVAELFEKEKKFLSSDYHAEDVAIGHSYFLAEDDEKLKAKIEYQVIPILEEYVKDGVLLEEANKEIEKIKDYFSNSGDLPRKWTIRKTGDKQYDPPLNKTVLEIIKSYVKEKRPKNIEELKKVFPDDTRPPFGVVQLRNDPKYKHFIMENGQPHHENYFVNDLLVLSDGNKIMVCNQWGASGQIKEYWERFTDRAKEQGYEIQIEEM